MILLRRLRLVSHGEIDGDVETGGDDDGQEDEYVVRDKPECLIRFVDPAL